ncbi:MAG: hypothetical protein RL839_12340 [Gammaproteobacteria bacterium]
MRYFFSQLSILLSLVAFESVGQAQLEPARLPQADSTAQELHVLNPGLAPEEIDRAVLTRLLNEISVDAERVAALLDASSEELEEISVTLANARSFVNSNEMASVRAMCNAWNSSRLDGDDRIQQALDAYQARKQYTLNFVQRYYSVVVRDIQAILDEQSTVLFNRYLQDRRRRMANAGSAFTSAIVENVRSGAESVEFHCGLPRE